MPCECIDVGIYGYLRLCGIVRGNKVFTEALRLSYRTRYDLARVLYPPSILLKFTLYPIPFSKLVGGTI